MDEENGVSRIDIILIFQAYNRRDISFEEFIRLTREWAEAMARKHESQKQVTPDL